MTATQIDESYHEVFSLIERETRRLNQILAEHKMREEASRLKVIQVKQREKLKIH